MRKWFPLVLFGLIICIGCSGGKLLTKKPAPVFDNAAVGLPPAPPPEKSEPRKPAELIVTPGNTLTGKVARYNDAGRFTVLDFPLGHTPQAEQRMFVYRRGLKVGEVKISEWQRENLIVADLITGEAQAGDEVRSK